MNGWHVLALIACAASAVLTVLVLRFAWQSAGASVKR